MCLPIETDDPDEAFRQIKRLLAKLAEVSNGANSGLVFLEDLSVLPHLRALYQQALSGLVNRHRVERLLRELRARTFTLGNGMGLVGAASSLSFAEDSDHTFELIAYRLKDSWGTPRLVDASSVRAMDRSTFPHTFNNYDYQKRKVLITPHGPDPVFVGIRGDSPAAVATAFNQVRYDESLEGYMVYLSNQHTDAHLANPLNWKVFSSGWADGVVDSTSTGPGGHLYVTIRGGNETHPCAIYEPTGDLRRAMKLLRPGDSIRVFGGVRRGTPIHPKVLNVEKVEVIASVSRGPKRHLRPGIYVSSPRANRHLTKPLIRYGRETARQASPRFKDWFWAEPISRPTPARSR